MHTDNGVKETLKDALQSNDEPLGKKVPGAPFALVALSYLGILLLVSLGIAAFLWLR